ncbi:MAG: ATP-dependent helicase [Actinomycetota bacterium]|nr:ATP-dependent helicase [Actinomycetota bacterium]
MPVAAAVTQWSSPSFRLLRTHLPAAPAPALDVDQRRVVAHDRGVLRVLAGPGTGKTTTLIESAAQRVTERGVPVENLLLLTFSRRAAGQLRDRVTARLQRTIGEPVARTFHSYAFGLVRQAAVLTGDPPPRLLSGSEQDVTLRELLAGRLADRTDRWPPELSAAIQTQAFADELRELLMRAIERDVWPERLAALGEKYGRPDWLVAADVLLEYLEVTSLKAPGAFDAAELIQRAVAELRDNPSLLAAERAKRRRIFVDEYQDTDPAQIELLKLIAAGADELVLIGDPDQAIYAFRGAEQSAMADIDLHFGSMSGTVRTEHRGQLEFSAPVETVSLSVCRRSGPVLLAASRRIASRLSGPAQHRQLRPAAGLEPGWLTTAVFGSASHEAAYLASALRRAHAEGGVPWSEMAVLVRSSGPAADTLRRGLVAADVPVGQSVQGPLTDDPVVSQLLDLLRAVAEPASVTAEDAEALLVGMIGRADPLQILRMQRHLRRVPDGPLSLADLIVEPAALAWLPDSVRAPVQRLRTVIEAGTAAVAGSGLAEDVLWAIWQATGLSNRLNRRSLAGRSDGARADRALDAVLALFAEAAKVTDRTPGGGAGQLHDWISQLQITDAEVGQRRHTADEVSILTAHASKGLQWQVVCVAGVQDGSWPNLRRRGSLLGADLLVDVLAERPVVSSGLLAERLTEERRLFYVAITRASRRLLVTAVDSEESQPSRFLDELDPLPETVVQRPVTGNSRRFVLPGLVAELRGVLVDEPTTNEPTASEPTTSEPTTSEPTTSELTTNEPTASEPTADRADDLADREQLRAAAAEQLAVLAAAGVPGAHPDDWWGRAPLSTGAAIRPATAGPVPIRPSKFEAYTDCELRALLTELGATDATDEVAASLGTLVHAVAEQAPADASVAELTELLEQGWSRLDFGAPWHATGERARAQRMLVELAGWLTSSRAELTLVAKEAPFKVTVGDAQLSGKVDRLERDSAGRLVVIDLKTGKNKPTRDEVAGHPQLAAYQVAVAEGGFTDGTPVEPGGAQLVQLGATTAPGTQKQPALADFSDPGWVHAELARIAEVLRGNTVTARPGKSCARCLVRASCPVQDDGRQVTQ